MKQTILLSLICAGAILAAQSADPRIGGILNQLGSTRTFQQVEISPDGKRVAWVERTSDGGVIFVKDGNASPVRIGAGGNIAWSPDSQRIAFLADHDQKGQVQLYAVGAKGGRAKKLTDLKGYVTDPRWSPDGSKIAILYAENAPSGGGPLEAEPVETGVIGGAIYNQRLAIVDANSGGAKQISPADLNVYEYDWSPDSHSFALTAAPGPGDNNWWIAQALYDAGRLGKDG